MRILIVDDEPVARRGLRKQLDSFPGIKCVGECAGRLDAIEAIVSLSPDLVFLDIQLGRSTSFDIIADVGADAMPLVVFVTAYDRHALRAFEVHALDYVLKPVDPDRLKEAIDRAAVLLALQRGASLTERLEGLLATHERSPVSPPSASYSERFVVRDGDRLRLIDSRAIDWFESAGNYVRVHSGTGSYLMRSTMDTVVRRLGAANFVRARRSALVNVASIASIERYSKTAFVLHLKTGTKVISSRFYHADMRRLVRPSENFRQ